MKIQAKRTKAIPAQGTRSRHRHLLTVLSFAAVLVALVFSSNSFAGTQVIDYFGGESGSGSLGGEFNNPQGIAVNNTGAGSASTGDVYVVDGPQNRIQRFARADSGTPAEPYDDTYEFISAWGADVDSTPSGGDSYEICTLAADCKAGVPSGGNGGLDTPKGIAVDGDTGNVYVADVGNHRVNVYDGAGVFLRSLGYGVVGSGPGQVSGPDEQQQLTVTASGGKFSLSFAGVATGGRAIGRVKAGTNTITNVNTSNDAFAVGQGFSARVTNIHTELFPAGTTITEVSGQTLTVSQPANANFNFAELFGHDLDYNASAAEVEAALDALPSIGGVGGSVEVSGGPGDLTGSAPYTIDFGGSLAGSELPLVEPASAGLTITSGTASASAVESVKGGAYEVCVAAEGDVCQAGVPSDGVGGIGEALARGQGIAVSPADGNPATGTVFLADSDNGRIDSYALDGSVPSSFGSGTFATSIGSFEQPTQVAVDSRGIVYAPNIEASPSGQVEHSYVERYDTENANGQGVGFLDPIADPPLLSSGSPSTQGLAVDPDPDGAGPESDILYVLRNERVIQQFGPLNPPGLTAPPAAVDDEHGGDRQILSAGGLAIDEADGRLYVTGTGLFDATAGTTEFDGNGVYFFGVAGGPPSASIDSFDDITSTSATVHATINPNGSPALRYRFEYSTDGTNWMTTPQVLLGAQSTPQAVSLALDPPGPGLQPNTLYQVRIVARKGFGQPLITPALSFTTLDEPPMVETTGAPVRSATTAQLNGRVSARNAATTYFFEYGDQGPCDANPCTATPSRAAGSTGALRLVAEEIDGLQASTTYHYRLVADNGASGSPSFGEDMTLTTRSSDLPLSHGHLPGPPGSDRAYEQVNMPDTGGNPVGFALGFSENGNRVAYEIAGGTSLSNTGSLLSLFFAERTAAGWQTKPIAPPRDELIGATWFPPVGQSDLSSLVTVNTAETGSELASLWRLSPGAPPTKLFEASPPQKYGNWYATADDSSRTVALLHDGDLDPAFPTASQVSNLYDISTGTPRLVSILPDGKAPVCGVPAGSTTVFQIGSNVSHQMEGWISANGSRVFFLSDGDDCSKSPQLYARNLDADQTALVSKLPVSGPTCRVAFIRSIPDAVFFWTRGRLVAEDSAPANCGAGSTDGDVYRYDLGNESLKCITCVVPGLDADVYLDENIYGAQQSIAIAEDGSRIYFQSSSGSPLLPGAIAAPTDSTYRLDIDTGDLRWIGAGITPGLMAVAGNAITPDGSVIVFRSDDPSLNPLGGSDNDGSKQYYRYDDRDGSLVCVSCPQDGSAPIASASPDLLLSLLERQVGPNQILVADDGTVGFSTPVPLVGADQNTPGPGGDPESGEDVYEWRDGRLFLVSDGLTSWPNPPNLQGISHDGRNIYFTAPTQYTADALDGYNRLYDARIGGGFEFPKPPSPCPLEVCQGTPKGAPEESAPGTGSFIGPSSTSPRKPGCPYGKRKVRKGNRTRCVSTHHKKRRQRANNNRRAAR